MKREKVLLKNSFHNTSAFAYVPSSCITRCPDGSWYVALTVGQCSRAWNRLCGIADCSCSGNAGVRDNNRMIVDVIPCTR